MIRRRWGRWWNVQTAILTDPPAWEAWKRTAVADTIDGITEQGHTVAGEPVWDDPRPVQVREDFSWTPWDITMGPESNAEWQHVRLRIPIDVEVVEP